MAFADNVINWAPVIVGSLSLAPCGVYTIQHLRVALHTCTKQSIVAHRCNLVVDFMSTIKEQLHGLKEQLCC